MKYLSLLGLTGALALAIALTAFASGGSLQCRSTDRAGLKFIIKVTDTQISIASNAPEVKPTVWNLKDPGLYTYFAEDASGVHPGNFRTIDQVRVNIASFTKKLEKIQAGQQLDVQVAYSSYNIDMDHYTATGTENLYCRKL